jgi:hypothetical protein
VVARAVVRHAGALATGNSAKVPRECGPFRSVL